MKRDALNHPKMLDLASRLDISRAHAIGIVTLLLDFTAAYAPQGDIGKLRNGAIARACEWMGDPDQFIDALVNAGWLDQSDDFRLIVHDWGDHCETWVRAKLAKAKLTFVPGSGGRNASEATIEPSIEPTIEPSGEATIEASSRAPVPSLAKPSLAKPSQRLAKPSLDPPEASGTEVPVPALSSVDWSSAEESFLLEVRTVANRVLKLAPKIDPVLLWKACWACLKLNCSAIDDMIVKLRARSVNKPDAYLKTVMRTVCEERGYRWTDAMLAIPDPPRIKPVEAIEKRVGAIQ